MNHRRIVVLVLIIAAGVAAAVMLVRPSAEPPLHGHPISYWIEPWRHSRGETPDSIAAAYSEMESRHVRWLMQQLKWRPSSLASLGASALNALGLSVGFQGPADRREWAATALGKLGKRAEPAISLLRETIMTTTEPRGHQARVAARAALIRLGVLPAEAVIGMARDPSHPEWWNAVDIMARLGTNAPEGAAILSAIMFSTNPPAVRARATFLYGHFAPPLHEALPNLVRGLDDPATRQAALARILVLGDKAASATQAVARCLTDTNSAVRLVATNALRNMFPTLAPANLTR